MRREAQDWWDQAQQDFGAARDMLAVRRCNVCVFLVHQAVEKGLKALHIARLRRMPPHIHNLPELAGPLGAPEDLISLLRESNNEYLATRYPDVAMGVPAEMFDERIAKERLDQAEQVMAWIEKELTGTS